MLGGFTLFQTSVLYGEAAGNTKQTAHFTMRKGKELRSKETHSTIAPSRLPRPAISHWTMQRGSRQQRMSWQITEKVNFSTCYGKE